MNVFRLLRSLLLILALSVSAHAQSAFETLATSMAAGDWEELSTTGMDAAFLGTGGASGILNAYGMTMVYDSSRDQLHFPGSDHLPPPYRHIRFDLATNTWSNLGTPSYHATHPDIQSYDLTAINVTGRRLYRSPYNQSAVFYFDLDTNGTTWTALPASPLTATTINAMDFFVARNSLIYLSSGQNIYEFSETTQLWANITPAGMSLASTWTFVVCNDNLAQCLLGSSTGQLWKYSSAGVMTQLAAIPSAQRTYDGSGFTGVWTVDETSGDYLILTDGTNGTGRNVYKFNSATGVYTLNPTGLPNKFAAGNWGNCVAAPVAEFNVTAWACASSGGAGLTKLYLYKHSAGAAPPADTTAPTVSILAPVNSSTVSGTQTILASASDNFAVVGVQFKVFGVNQGSEDLTAPYTAEWNTAVLTPGTYALTAVARDAAGNTATSAAISVTVAASAPPPPNADFTARCTAVGVVKCVGFDSAGDVDGRYPEPNGLLASSGDPLRFPTLDTAQKASGASSLMFTVPSLSGADPSGSYYTNFSDDFTVQFDAGQSFYYQWRQRFSTDFLANNWAPIDGAWKQTIMGTGSTGTNVGWPGVASSCSSIDIVMVGGITKKFPTLYNSCSGSASHGPYDPFEEPFQGDIKLENARPAPYCLYSQGPSNYFPPNGNCFRYYANEWMTFQVGVTVGPRVGDEFVNSYVKLWGAREGQPSELIFDWGPYNLTAGSASLVPRERFGQIFLTPYMTGKDAMISYPIAYTWYDELIVSWNKIADPGATSTEPPPADTAAPNVSITAPAPAAAVSGTISVAATATDNVAVSGVRFTIDGVSLGVEDTTAPYSASWNTTTATNAAHSIVATARDAAGNTAVAQTTVTVNNAAPDVTAPAVSVTGPADAATVSGAVTITAAASDAVGVVGVQFTIDGSATGVEDLVPPYSISWNSTTVANGSRVIRAVARDAAGNATTSSAITVTVNNGGSPPPDTTVPTVSVTAPANGATVTSTVTLTATASDNVAVVGVRFTANGVQVGSEDTTTPYSVSWNTAGLANGLVTLNAIARDAAGNQATAITYAFSQNPLNLPDAAAPTVSFKTTSGTTFTNSKVIQLAVADNVGVAICTTTINGRPGPIISIFTSGAKLPATTQFYLQQATIPVGTYVLGASCQDAAGNTGTAAPITIYRK